MALSARMPELRSLEMLLTVARTGSLNATAAEIGVTQQAVSARVSALETQTGVRLVSRTAHGSKLTDAGVVVAEWADRLLTVAAEVDAGLATLRHAKQTRLRISASMTIAEQLLPGWLVSLQAAARATGRQPLEVLLTATNSDAVLAHVRGGDADLGFVEGPTVPRSVRSRTIGSDQMRLVVRPDHPWARRSRRVSARELATTPLVSREPGSGTREALRVALDDVLGADRESAAPVLELSTAAAVRQAVLAGAGPAVLSELAVSGDVATGALREVPVADVDLHRLLHAVWLGARTPPAGAARDLLAHIAGSRLRAAQRVRR
ncbi:MAG TPA: LysR family transcriptional regulator [Jatrophihabitans sp.]|nr:LysR family transcriptional regulator [Jatrophihabitans sp.]